jgi:site-specific recombinase XerD
VARVTVEQIARLMETAPSAWFDDVRDRAIMWLFIATDAEPSELARMRPDDVDLGSGSVALRERNGNARTCALSPEAVAALREYVVVRARWPHAAVYGFWLGGTGEMGTSEIVRVVRDRGSRAGLGDVLHPPHPHVQ